MIDVENLVIRTNLLLGLDFDSVDISLKQKIFNYLCGKGIIRCENYLFGGN